MRLALPCLALILPTVAFGQGLSPEEDAIVPRILDHICVDLRDDWIGCAEITLLADDANDAADLILRPNRNDDAPDGLTVIRGIAFNGTLFGQRPSLEAGPNGSFKLRSEQTGIGRSPWEMTLSVAWRDEALVVAGVTYGTWDRHTAQNFSCDMNLRTGGYEIMVNDARQSGKTQRQTILLQDWSMDRTLPPPCEAALNDWWPE